MISKEDQTSLIWLQWHWDKRYVIKLIGGSWQAHPTGTGAPLDVLTADSAMELRDLMKADLAERASRQRH